MYNIDIFTIASFNCRGVKRSVDSVRKLCLLSDIIGIQESWLYPDELSYLDTIDTNFSSTGTSAIDTTAGMVRGRPYGGVGILWRSAMFTDVSVVKCANPRVCAIKVVTADRPFLVINVYMPTDSTANLPDFTDCLSAVSAMVSDYDMESVYLMGDFNAHPHELFYNELMSYCCEQDWCCVDIKLLGLLSDTYTYVSDAHFCRRWLDHFVLSQCALLSVQNVYVDYNVTWSDHFPIILTFNVLQFVCNTLLFAGGFNEYNRRAYSQEQNG